MACDSWSKAKKGCVFDEDMLSCQRCIRLGKMCVPKHSQKTAPTTSLKSSKALPPQLHLLKTNRMKSTLSGTTYQVDGHVTGLCHRRRQGIVMTPTCVSFNNSFPAQTITIHHPLQSSITSTLWGIGGSHPNHHIFNLKYHWYHLWY